LLRSGCEDQQGHAVRAAAGVTPRRLKIDSKGMVWIGDYFGGSLTRFDPNSKEFKIFKLPGPMPTPYGVAIPALRPDDSG
jgi:streptogramin lyase